MSKKELQHKTYNSLDLLPVFNWWQIHETGDLKWLFLEPLKAKPSEYLSELWELLCNQYFDKFGLTKNYINIIELKTKIALLICERWTTDDASIEAIISIEKTKLNELINKSAKSDFLATKVFIETKLKFQINLHTTSVTEYYSYLTSAQNG